MKKRILTLLSLILIGTLILQSNGLGLFDKKVAYAVGDLTVTWATTPLFNYSNIAPGFMVTKNVNVANGAPSSRPVAVKGILTSDPGNMKSVMHIEIKEGANVLYSNTLAQFFTDSSSVSGIPLSTLPSGNNTNYSFKVTFDSSAGNQFQNKSIVFDLQIGIGFDLPPQCEDINFNGKIIFGTSGNDNISGTSKNDLVISFEGKDTISTGGGRDCVVTSGGGDDSVSTGSGNDVVVTGSGNDNISTGEGDDYIDSGSGNDEISSGSGNDTVFAGSGNDQVYLGNGNDNADLGDGDDKASGGAGNDNISGGGGNDTMEGGAGNDTLIGGAGNDKANGNAGIDTCDAETEVSCEL